MLSRRERWIVVLISVVVSATCPTVASASHPNVICLDIGPDTRTATTTDDTIEQIEAKVGASDAGHPPQQEGCVTGGEGGDYEVHFEIVGAADPDGSNTPETPDMACTASARYQCYVGPPPSEGGTQTIRAWINSAENVEADMSEGYDEDAQPGDAAEPDGTDVTFWTWADNPPPPSCGDSGVCQVDSRITIGYNRRAGTFSGQIASEVDGCRGNRWVRLWKAVRGSDRRVAEQHLDHSGTWSFDGFKDVKGRIYAIAYKSRVGIDGTEPPAHYECLRDRSRSVRVR